MHAGNAFTYSGLPLGSFRFRKTFPYFTKTCVQRGLIHSLDYNQQVQFCQLVHAKLLQRGYGDTFLGAVFATVTWGGCLLLVFPCEKPASELDLRSVWPCANAVGICELFASCDLNLDWSKYSTEAGFMKYIL